VLRQAVAFARVALYVAYAHAHALTHVHADPVHSFS